MRKLLPVLLLLPLAGCATGYAQDWFRSRTSIINPQLLRYGLDVQQSRCVGERLGARLGRARLSDFQERAAAVRPSGGNEVRLTVANLRGVASTMPQRDVRMELDAALGTCNVPLAPVNIASLPAEAPPAASGTTPAMSGGVPVDPTPITPGSAGAGTTAAGAAGGTWLNLGSAESGQSIAIDASSIQQEGGTRIAWFRMTDPQSGGRSNNSYRLKIDCQARTVQPLALRQFGANGEQTSLREYTPAEAQPGPAESGTVLEIAFLSLCT